MMWHGFRPFATTFAIGLLAMVAGGAAPPPAYTVDAVALADGGTTPRFRLANAHLVVEVLPELGGKITSLRTVDGREFLSRSDRPYRKRVSGQDYGETEFDGIDELFPSLAPSEIGEGHWRGVKVPDHGDLVTQPWRVVDGPGVTLEVSGLALPYVFRRSATLEADTLVLAYTVTNTSAHPLPFSYTFHPLLAGEAGARFVICGTTPMTVSWSSQSFLGRRGAVVKWEDVPDGAGGRLRDAVFQPGSGRYYKLFSPRLETGGFRLEHADGHAIELSWPADRLPYYAIWCSEGGVDGLHHIGIEPTTDTAESLAGAMAAGEAPELPPFGDWSWRIRLRVTAPDAP